MEADLKYEDESYAVKTAVKTYGGIRPFTQLPSEGKYNKANAEIEGEKIKATQLFSLFTADIIKEEVIFTR